MTSNVWFGMSNIHRPNSSHSSCQRTPWWSLLESTSPCFLAPAYPTLVLHDGVAELAAAPRRDLGVVPAQQLETPPVRLVLQVEVRHRVEAVVGQVLRGAG